LKRKHLHVYDELAFRKIEALAGNSAKQDERRHSVPKAG
jgi:hypothetical protein